MTDNPRAFPSAAIDDSYGGMNLRDWFAGMAMLGLAPRFVDVETHRVGVELAYRIADAMLEARKLNQ